MATTETCVCTCDGDASATYLAVPGANTLRKVDWGATADSVKQAGLSLAGLARDSADKARGSAGELRDASVEKAKDLSESSADRAKSLRKSAKHSAKDLRKWLRGPAQQRARQGKDFVAERTGRRRRRSRWVTAGWVLAAITGAAAGLAFTWKRLAAPGYDEESFWDGRVDERAEPVGEPHAYPSTGSGAGWPEPQRTPEHVESLNGTNGLRPHQDGASSPASLAAFAAPAAPATPFAELSMAQNDGPSIVAAATYDRPVIEPAAGEDRTMEFPAYSAPAGHGPGTGGATAVPSEPAQRPPTPFTEDQAENNARMQLRQNELLAAFPAMTLQDIVSSDGDLDALAETVAPAAGITAEAARARVDAILGLSPAGPPAPNTGGA
ncbi:MAG: hypothetical protein ACYDCQ_14130 [Dehalococcoidia bacterium]